MADRHGRRDIDRTELYLAGELFFLGTGWEVLPIVEVDGMTIGDGTMGPVTRQLDRAYHDAVRGRSREWREWNTGVWVPCSDTLLTALKPVV